MVFFLKSNLKIAKDTTDQRVEFFFTSHSTWWLSMFGLVWLGMFGLVNFVTRCGLVWVAFGKICWHCDIGLYITTCCAEKKGLFGDCCYDLVVCHLF